MTESWRTGGDRGAQGNRDCGVGVGAKTIDVDEPLTFAAAFAMFTLDLKMLSQLHYRRH